MEAEIITSGTELLLGEIPDTNTAYIAVQLAGLGINLYYTSTVGDNFERYSGVLKQAWERSDLIITTGGLGPTQGDITREVVSTMLGEKMEIDPQLKKELTEFFTRMHIDMPDNNLKQATLIPSARPLRNTAGTAPGWWVEKDGRTIIVLPGPPREMQTMWQNAVLPLLEKKRSAFIMSRVLKTWGMAEANVDLLIAPFLKSANPTLGIYAKPDGIQLRITARDNTKEGAAALIAAREREIREVLKDRIWGADDDTLERVAVWRLAARKKSLAVAESFTGGLLARSLSGIPEGKEFFRGGLVITGSGRESWGLEEASAETASRMAAIAREKFEADIGLAIDGPEVTGLPVPGGRLFIAIDSGDRSQVFPPGYLGRPDQVTWRTANHALILLRDFIDRT
jgi:nicotinamide-nucleotide amidase